MMNGATGTLTVSDSGTFTNNGTISNYGEIVVQEGGLLFFDSGSIQNFNGASVEISGSFYMAEGTTFANDSGGTVTNTSETGLISIQGATAVFTNDGLLQNSNSASMSNLGTVTNGSTGTFQHNSGTQLTNGGTFSVALGTFTSGGTIDNTGTFTCPTGQYFASNACNVIAAYHWRGTTNGVWTTATNWFEGSVPPSGSAVVIDANAVRTAVLSSSATLASIVVVPNEALTVASAGTLVVSGPVTMCGTLLVQGSMTTNGAVADKGAIKIAPTGTLNVNSTLTIDASKTFTESGTLVFGGSSTLTNNGTLTNFGSITFPTGSTVTNNGTFNFASGTLTNSTTVTNNGTITCASGKSWNGSACAVPVSSSSSSSSSEEAPSAGGGRGSEGGTSNLPTTPTVRGTAQASASSASPAEHTAAPTQGEEVITLPSGLSFNVPAERSAAVDMSDLSTALTVLSGSPSVIGSNEKPVTRADAIVAILKQFNVPIDADARLKFSDVDVDAKYAAALATAAKLGLITGYENEDGTPTGKFGPENRLKSYELKILVRRLQRLPEFRK